ncbi:transcription factor HES-4-like [Neocloeon triangulifer]|uniref:transcription factor HES-4-like n=1 Tax=Neocloeon triangulifer TaxID=2078957 RepID=UPI00286EFFDB|nr:transcription factor HES-4-like [Neocloeon triangulifer]
MSPSQQAPAMASPHSSSGSSSSSSSPPPPQMTPNPQSAASPPQRKPVSEHRRCNKPIMEKKRRQRINNCLEELKSLILDALKKDPARHSKLEKADILEMTVKHLESLHRQQSAMSVAADPGVLNKYRAGFSECASEVDKFLGKSDSPQLDPHIKRRLLAHLSSCLNNVTALDNMIMSPGKPAAEETSQPRTLRVQIPASSMQIPPGGQHVMHLVPTCLPSGDIAFVIPKTIRSPPIQQLSPPPLVEQPQFSPAAPPASFSPPLPPLESPRSLAARTAVVAPLSVALDLSISNVPLKQEEDKLMECGVNVEPEDVWRPW